MTHFSQPDLFSAGAQGELFGAPPVRDWRPDPEKVRGELLDVLAKARAAPDEPWKRADMDFYRTVFPQMARWLPEQEALELQSEFEAELQRLEAA